MADRLGRYILETRLAHGGMAEVFLARQTGPEGFQKQCVVKRMLSHLAEEENFVRMFLDEARLAAQLNHPNIAQIFDFGEDHGSYFLAMEYVPGSSLRAIVKDHARRAAFIPTHLCARIVADAAAALHYAHTAIATDGTPLQVIHRDVSPQNILIGTTGVVKLIDFGVAKARSATQRTRTGLVKGKFAYMSPEQLRGQPLDQRSDIYSLGLVLYEVLASRRAIQGENDVAIMQAAMRMAFPPISDQRTDVPPGLEAILERALERDRERRFESAAAMGRELERFLASSGRTVAASDVGALTVEGLVRRNTDETPSSMGAGVVAEASSEAFWENAPNALTLMDPGAMGKNPEASTRVSAPPKALLNFPVQDTSAAGESSASIARKAVGRGPAPAILAAVLACGSVGATVWWVRSPQVGPAVQSPPSAPIAQAPLPPPEPPATNAPAPAPVPLPPPVAPKVERAVGTLWASSTPSVGLIVDGQPRGRTPLRLSLPPGEHALLFKDDQLGLSHAASVQVVRDNEARIDWRAEKGSVMVRATPYAEVFMGPKSLGLTPLDPLELWEGRHTLRFVNPETQRSETREVDVRAGQQIIVKVDLRAP